MNKAIQLRAEKFATGYNAKADSWNNRTNDLGKCPFRGTKAAGYNAARSHILERQFANEGIFTVEKITSTQALEIC